MFTVAENAEIGKYLDKLVLKKYKSARQFCLEYLKEKGQENDATALQNMTNRYSQIKKGAKGIQISDLDVFCKLLNVTCEEILSAGNYFLPYPERMTNYKIAFSKDPKEWEEFIHRDDQLILHNDEYGKTVIEYALEFKNYGFLKYLMDNHYIWFIGDDPQNYFDSFTAGTSIERRTFLDTDYLELKLVRQDNLRRQMISLAIENNDFKMLTDLKAREIPTFYMACYYSITMPKCQEYYDAELIEHVSKSNTKVLNYFSQEIEITDRFDCKHKFFFPFISNILEILIKKHHRSCKAILKNCIAHNQYAYDKLVNLGEETLHEMLHSFFHWDSYNEEEEKQDKKLKADIIDTVQHDIRREFEFKEDGNMINFRGYSRKDGIVTNIIKLDIKSNDGEIQELIDQLNTLYNKIKTIEFAERISL